jgi:alpha-beta hydrolase superfamily lysophospholipase
MPAATTPEPSLPTPATARAAPARSRWQGAVLALAAVALLSGCAIVDFEQRRWIFQPTRQTWAAGEVAAQGMRDVWIDHVSAVEEQRGQAVRLHGLWLPQADTAAPVLLFLHGARWDVRASAPRMRDLHALGFAVLGVDYRGFGLSTEALPSETLAAEDALAAWHWLARQHPQQKRYVYGHSLGAAIAVSLAVAVQDESGLIVEGAFTSTADVFRSYRLGWVPITPFITQTFDSASRIAQVGSPLLVLHGGDDGMVPHRLGRALYGLATPPKRFVLVDGAAHENASALGQEQFRQAVADLFGIRPGP